MYHLVQLKLGSNITVKVKRDFLCWINKVSLYFYESCRRLLHWQLVFSISCNGMFAWSLTFSLMCNRIGSLHCKLSTINDLINLLSIAVDLLLKGPMKRK